MAALADKEPAGILDELSQKVQKMIRLVTAGTSRNLSHNRHISFKSKIIPA